MSKKTPPQPAIDKALHLDGDPQTIKDYYAEWAESYDRDVSDEYVGAAQVVALLSEFVDGNDSYDKRSLVLADVGCGTGLAGVVLVQQGYTTIDGMDISTQMVEQAAKLGLYRSLHGDIDINQPPPEQWLSAYDAIVCAGVFTLGHVEPESLYHLAEMAKPGGLIVTSTRLAYYESTRYQVVSDEIEERGIATLERCLRDAPYTDDSDAHYWLYRVA